MRVLIFGILLSYSFTSEELTKTLRLQRNCYLWSLSKTLTGKDLYNSVINSLIRSGLSLDKLASIATDGAPSLTGKHSGFEKLMNDKIKEDFPAQCVVLSLHHTSRKPL